MNEDEAHGFYGKAFSDDIRGLFHETRTDSQSRTVLVGSDTATYFENESGEHTGKVYVKSNVLTDTRKSRESPREGAFQETYLHAPTDLAILKPI